ncbi:MAG: asparagine synthase-related protein [Winkia neuii]|uniref:asparagine synthase-related protein n=1 Tax=Winkia neuii TaxID=33007 RepID=UPI0028FF5CA1|nr:asparagine synthase-related protein [Winkia neuii]MDU3134369.1 asparagine synthase-related protein [Winkia neuii]
MGFEISLRSDGWVSDSSGKLHVWAPLKPEFDLAALAQPLSQQTLAQLPGQWTIVDQRSQSLVLASDRVRSHPLCYGFDGKNWVVTDDVNVFQGSSFWHLNRQDAALFPHIGYVLSDRTLLEGVRALQAGTRVELGEGGQLAHAPYFTYGFLPDPVTDQAEYAQLFTAALEESLGRVLNQAGSRQLVIPLSGGLDSRLMAAFLKQLGAPNVLTFTYGKEGSKEGQISHSVAADLHLPWLFVPLNPAQVRKEWASEQAREFMASVWKGVALPHVQDYYALTQMRQKELIDPDAVILPGHTIVGNMHDEQVLQRRPSGQELNRLLALHHANQQGRSRRICSAEEWLQTVRELADQVRLGRTERDLQAYFEWFNIAERQAKYINNSMAGYEFFGYSWALPMLDLPMWQVWVRGSEELTATRDWYACYTDEIYYRQTGKHLGLFSPKSTQMSPALKQQLLKGMRLLGADKLLAKYRSIRTMVNHPMAFEAFSRKAVPAQVGAYILGASQMGLWASEFVHNEWGNIVPSAQD